MGKNMTVEDGVTRHTPSSRTVTKTIITAIGEVTNTDPVELPPLGSAIDPNALNELFPRNAAGDPRIEGYVTFEFAGCVVLVDQDDRVVVLPRTDEPNCAAHSAD